MKRTISSFITCIICINFFAAFSVNAQVDEEARVEKIEALFEMRAEAVLQEDYNKLDEIEEQLARYQVLAMEPEEVEAFINNTQDENENGIMPAPRVALPSNKNVSWYSYRSTVSSGGTKYEIQRLTASPNASNSNLKKEVTVTLKQTKNVQAAKLNLYSSLAKSGASSIPIVGSVGMTIYDATKSYLSGLSTTSTVSGVGSTYKCTVATTVVFAYVKKDGTADKYQTLAGVSTKASVAIGYLIPKFTYGKSTTAQIISGSKSFSCVPSNYDNTTKIISAYKNISQHHAKVTNITVKGIEGKTVMNLSPLAPNNPINVG